MLITQFKNNIYDVDGVRPSSVKIVDGKAKTVDVGGLNNFNYQGSASEYFARFKKDNYLMWAPIDTNGDLGRLVDGIVEGRINVANVNVPTLDRAVLPVTTQPLSAEGDKVVQIDGQVAVAPVKFAAQVPQSLRTAIEKVDQTSLDNSSVETPLATAGMTQPIQPRAPNTSAEQITPVVQAQSTTLPTVTSKPALTIPKVTLPTVITPTPVITDNAVLPMTPIVPVTPILLGSQTKQSQPIDTAMLVLPADTTKVLVEDRRIKNLSNDVIEFDGITILPNAEVSFDRIEAFEYEGRTYKLPIVRDQAGNETIAAIVKAGNITFNPNDSIQFSQAGQIERIGNVTFRAEAQDISQARASITQPFVKSLGSLWISAVTHNVANPDQPTLESYELDVTSTPNMVLRATGWSNALPVISNEYTATTINKAIEKLDLPQSERTSFEAITIADGAAMEGATYAFVDTERGQALVINKTAIPQLLNVAPVQVIRLTTTKTADELGIDLSARKTVMVSADEFNRVLASPQAAEKFEAIKDDIINHVIQNTTAIDIRDTQAIAAAELNYYVESVQKAEQDLDRMLAAPEFNNLPRAQRRSLRREKQQISALTKSLETPNYETAQGFKVITNDEMEINDLVEQYLTDQNFNPIEVAQFKNLFDMRTLGGHADGTNIYLTPMAAQNTPYQV
ncbi:MAG: hypothetical protein K8I00_11205, partial [Candidatus Omnitrophica bacterium]|nr:hypothetical protein [Candidatus Omnitrophota bacterium]